MGRIIKFKDWENCVVIYDHQNQRWLLFRQPIDVHVAHSSDEVSTVLQKLEDQVESHQLYAAGFVSYEAAPAFDPVFKVKSPDDFPLAWFGIYSKPERISLPASTRLRTERLLWKPSISEDKYDSIIRRIREYLGSGDTYQVNYSFRLRSPFSGDPWALFVQIIEAQGSSYGAFVNIPDWSICSASPELFFRLSDRHLICRPMKGTATRGLWQAHDLEQSRWLKNSEKNRAENVMIVDMVRNDMGKIADAGSVQVPRLFDVEKYPTLWQMTSTIHCITRAQLPAIFSALFPPASITGAPKVRTMEIITELESSPRRIYTGSIGFLAPGRRSQFNVAIRTVVVDRRRDCAEYGVGGGIVWDSVDTAEFEECATKAKILSDEIPDFDLLETILWTPAHGYFLLARHLRRLQDSALYFSRPVDLSAIRHRLALLTLDLPPHPHRIRLLVSQDGEPLIESMAISPTTGNHRICLAETPVNSQNKFLYHKTSYRHVYQRALDESHGCDDVLLWNRKGEVTESCIANVVVEKHGELLTPPVHCGLLPGTYRSLLLEQKRIREEIVQVEDLPDYSKIFLVNSVRKMWEVSIMPGEI